MNRTNKELLRNTLEELDMSLECAVRYDKNILSRLCKKYVLYEVGRKYYCCLGLEKSCWGNVYSLGQNGFTDKILCDASNKILKRHSEYLYNTSKYGNRIYVKECEDKYCRVFVYLRDLVGSDFEFVFSN